MKSIKTVLEKSNLTPRERILVLIKNDIHEQKTGKSILTEQDKNSLSKEWIPETHYQHREYNKYRKLWNTYGALTIDMQTWFLNELLRLSDFMKILYLFYYREDIKYLQNILEKKLIKNNFTKDNIIKNSGLNYNEVLEKVSNLEGIVKKENLVIKTITRKFTKFTYKVKIITGESLYYADESINFIKEYKKHINKIYMFEYLIEQVKLLKSREKYAQLLAYKEVENKMSDILETKVYNNSGEYLLKFEEVIEEINNYLQSVFVNIEDELFMNRKTVFYTNIFFERFKINLENVKPKSQYPLNKFNKEAYELLSEEWKN